MALKDNRYMEHKNKKKVMGRAIDMEKDIDMLKIEVQKLNNIIRGMVGELSEINDVIFEEEETKEEKKDGKKKADTKGNGKSDKSSDTTDGNSNKKDK